MFGLGGGNVAQCLLQNVKVVGLNLAADEFVKFRFKLERSSKK